MTLNFDSIPVSPTTETGDASSYLMGYGISISSVTPGTQVVAMSDQTYGGHGFISPSSPNVLTQIGGEGVTFTLNFPCPVSNITFTRPYLIAYTTGQIFPEWTVTAYNHLGGEVGSVGQYLIDTFQDTPAETFTITGTDISQMQVAGNDQGDAGYSTVLIDNLELNYSECPASSTSTCGIDLSSNNAVNSWSAVRADGYQFALMRASLGSCPPTPCLDSSFPKFMAGALSVNLGIGAYAEAYPKQPTAADAISQAETFVEYVSGSNPVGVDYLAKLSIPPVLAVECKSTYPGLAYLVNNTDWTRDQVTEWVLSWLGYVAANDDSAGSPMVYSSASCLNSYYFDEAVPPNSVHLDQYKIWVAKYSQSQPVLAGNPWKAWAIWQSSETGVVPGVTGFVDLDYEPPPALVIPTGSPVIQELDQCLHSPFSAGCWPFSVGILVLAASGTLYAVARFRNKGS